jgi:hypothetical protein
MLAEMALPPEVGIPKDEGEGLSYEAMRERNIAQNEAIMRILGLTKASMHQLICPKLCSDTFRP